MRKNKQTGFTLVEMVVVISIMAIIGGLSSLIIGRSLDSYAALDRRQKLQTSIRLVLERISREVRHALPYSLCVYDGAICSSSANEKFYFLPIKSSGRYQDLSNGSYSRDYGGNRHRAPKRGLRILPSDDDELDVLSTNDVLIDGIKKNRLNAIGNVDTTAGNSGDWVVVFNTNNSDIYEPVAAGHNIRHQIHSITPKDAWENGDPNHSIDMISFADYTYPNPAESDQVGFANHSPTRRLHIIANDVVTLFYKQGRNLYRDTTTFAAPQTPVNPRLLMENVEACTFTYISGGLQQAAILRIDITVEDQGERVQVVHEVHFYNVP